MAFLLENLEQRKIKEIIRRNDEIGMKIPGTFAE